MTQDNLDADYLVVGAGAMGMAFADALMTDTTRTPNSARSLIPNHPFNRGCHRGVHAAGRDCTRLRAQERSGDSDILVSGAGNAGAPVPPENLVLGSPGEA